MSKLIRVAIALLLISMLFYSLCSTKLKIDIEPKSKVNKDDRFIYVFKGPGPISTWVILSRKREQRGCSTEGQFNDPCVNIIN